MLAENRGVDVSQRTTTTILEAVLPLDQTNKKRFRTRETTVKRARSYDSHVSTGVLCEKNHFALNATQNIKVLCSKGLQDDRPGSPR